jgi:sugar lactone lactonase YvrE
VKPVVIVTGLCFGEAPRWHDGRLWLSDMHDRRVLTVDAAGTVTSIVEVPGCPSGLGWTPGGELLIVSMTDRRVLRFDGRRLHVVADLARLASFHCNDMVVDATGRAYVGNFGFDLFGRAPVKTAELLCVEADGRAAIVAQDLAFPNGMVITPDAATLIVAETFGRRLTAFEVEFDGNLVNRRVWATLPEEVVPDGICLDEAGGVWLASPTSNECVRVEEGGRITHRVAVEQGAYACTLGGADRTTLFMLTAASSNPEKCRAARSGRIEAVPAPFPGAGLP